MKRLGRIVYRLLSGLSLVLLLATAGVWVRSYWVSDQLSWSEWPEGQSSIDQKKIWSSRGGIRLRALRYRPTYVAHDDPHIRHHREPATKYPAFGDELSDAGFNPKPRPYAALGFEWIPGTTTNWTWAVYPRVRINSFTLPLYFPCLLFAILPAHFVLRLRRRMARRLALGCCVGCGYDLRASSGRCPECGRVESSANSPQ